MSGYDTIIYEKKARIAHITLNRPQVLNVYNVRMRDELYQILSAVKDDPETYTVVMKGTGEKPSAPGPTSPNSCPLHLRQPPGTCAGAGMYGDFSEHPPTGHSRLTWLCIRVGHRNGHVLDIRIASDDVVMGLPEVALGIIPAAGATQTAPRAIGRATRSICS